MVLPCIKRNAFNSLVNKEAFLLTRFVPGTTKFTKPYETHSQEPLARRRHPHCASLCRRRSSYAPALWSWRSTPPRAAPSCATRCGATRSPRPRGSESARGGVPPTGPTFSRLGRRLVCVTDVTSRVSRGFLGGWRQVNVCSCHPG